MSLQNLTDKQREKLRKVKNYTTLTVTVVISLVLGWVLVYKGWPRHWEIVDGSLKMVFSGFDLFTRQDWVKVLGGTFSIAFLFGVFVLSLKYPLLAGSILLLIAIPFIIFFTGAIGDVNGFLDVLFWVGVFTVGVLLLISSILNLGFQTIPKSHQTWNLSRKTLSFWYDHTLCSYHRTSLPNSQIISQLEFCLSKSNEK